MIKKYAILCDAGAGGSGGGGGAAGSGGGAASGAGAGAAASGAGAGSGGGAAAKWYDALPEDLRSSPTISSVPDVATLAKNYLNAEKLIGAKRIAVPGEKAQPAEWDAVWNALGRPDTLDKYGQPNVKVNEGVNLDATSMTKFRETAHKLGLTDGQFRGVMDYYLTGINETSSQFKASTEATRAQATETLRKEWGDRFDANLDIAKNALRTYGGEEVMKELEGGLGNHVGLVKMLHKIGHGIMEDHARRTGTSLTDLTPATQAVQEIASLKMDSNFLRVFNNPTDPGHKASVDRWLDLHRKAYPGQVNPNT